MGDGEISFGYREQLGGKMDDYYSSLISLNKYKESNYKSTKAAKTGAFGVGGMAAGAAIAGPPGAIVGGLIGALAGLFS